MKDSASQSYKTAPLLHLLDRNEASTIKFKGDVLAVGAMSRRVAHTLRAYEKQAVG